MVCSAAPYQGSEPRASVIGAFCDDRRVWPLIEQAARKGLRVWHDGEIRRVRVDYAARDRAATDACCAHVVFLTEEAAGQHIFRERYTRAVESGKPTVVVLCAERDSLSPGMRLQVLLAAAVLDGRGRTPADLADALMKLDVLKPCAGEPDESVVLQSWEYAEPSAEAPAPARRPVPPSERTMAEFGIGCPSAEDTPAEAADPLEETVPLGAEQSGPDDLDKTWSPFSGAQLPVIACLTSGEKKFGLNGGTTVGRSRSSRGDIADVVFRDACPLFSRKHLQVLCVDGVCTLVCTHPNGVTVNGTTDLQEGERFRCSGLTFVQIPSARTLAMYPEKQLRPAVLAVAPFEAAGELWKAEETAFLQSRETGEIRLVGQRFKFGRVNAWRGGAMKSRSISRDHADIVLEDGQYLFRDHSSNGTVVDGKRVHNASAALKDGDVIAVDGSDAEPGGESFVFRCARYESAAPAR